MKHKSKGSLTAFACIMSAALTLLGFVSTGIVEYKSLETVTYSTVNTAVDAGLAARYGKLLEEYGLSAVQTGDAEREVQRVTATVFADENGKNGYAAQNVSATVTPVDLFTDPDALAAQITMLMAYAPTDGASQGAAGINEQIRNDTAQPPDVHYIRDHKLAQYIGKLLTTVQTELNAMEASKETLKTTAGDGNAALAAAKPYMERVARVRVWMTMIEELWPSFEDCLTDNDEQTTDEWFVINDYFGEIYREYYEEVGTRLREQSDCYEAMTLAVQNSDPSWKQHAAQLSALADDYPKLINVEREGFSPFDPNAEEVDGLLSQGAQLFTSEPIVFAYEPFETSGETDVWVSFDGWSASLFENVDTWREGWYEADVSDKAYHLQQTYLDEAERIFGSFPLVACEETNDCVDRYILRYFTHRHTADGRETVSAMPLSEIEYILAGTDDAAENRRVIFARIWAMRFYENYGVLAMDYPTESANSTDIEYWYCSMHDLVVQNFRRALVESYLETYRMVQYGDKVALCKTHGNMILTSTDSLAKGISPDTLSLTHEAGEVTVGYEEYLRWFLSMTDRDTKLARLSTVINENLALLTDGEAPDIRTLYASFEVTLRGDAARFASLAVMPGEDKKGLCPITVSVSRRGGYGI